MTKTLLLVEDEPIIALNEKTLLEKHGYSVVTVNSGEKALKTVEESVIDLILMDIDLGGRSIDGTETAQRILEKHDLPIIFLTNYSDKEFVDRVKGITRYGYLLKNSGEFVIIEAINMAFELFSANQQMKAEVKERRAAEQARDVSLQIAEDIVHSIPAGLFIYQYREPDRLYLTAGNPESQRLTGIDVENSIGKEFNEIWPQAQASGITDAFLKAYKTGVHYETEDLHYEDEHLTGAFKIRAFRMPNRQLCVAFENVTDSKKAERELKENEERFRSVVQMARDAIVVCSFDDTIIYWNDAAEQIFGYSSEEMTGHTVEKIIPPAFHGKYRVELKHRQEAGTGAIDTWMKEFTARRKDGSTVTVERTISWWRANDQLFVTRIYRDITRRRENIEKLQQSEERYRSLFEHAPDGIITVNAESIVTSCNSAFLALSGYQREEIVGRRFSDLPIFREEDLPAVTSLADSLFEGDIGRMVPLSWINRDGEERQGEARFGLYKIKNRIVEVQLIIQDITEKKQIEEQLRESENKYESLFTVANDAIILADAETGIIVDVNDKAEELTGRSREELIGLHQTKLHPQSIEKMAVESFKEDAAVGKSTQYKEFEVLHSDGRIIPVEIVPSVIELKGRKVIMGIFRDTTERKLYEQTLKKALQEKESLLQEINHRIKNNLTMVSALIRLKASSLGDHLVLSDVEHQIDAIRIVHEKLQISDHISYIDLNVYVQELLETIFSSFADRYVEIVNSIQEIAIPTNQAVSLGLIINEIATNAIKYGFTDDEVPTFSISLKKDSQNRHYVCSLSNSGNPFPEHIDFENPESLGLQIITLLVEQLEGKIHLRKQPTPEYTITLPLSEPVPGT